jgi:hypothetical protein
MRSQHQGQHVAVQLAPMPIKAAQVWAGLPPHPCPAAVPARPKHPAAEPCQHTHRREALDVDALGLQRLHLRGKPHAAVSAAAPVEGADADGVARRAEVAGALVPHHAGKDAVQAVPQLVGVAVLLVEVAHDGGVGAGVQIHARQRALADRLVVVNLRVAAAAGGGVGRGGVVEVGKGKLRE